MLGELQFAFICVLVGHGKFIPQFSVFIPSLSQLQNCSTGGGGGLGRYERKPRRILHMIWCYLVSRTC